jgi:hypothetical protein
MKTKVDRRFRAGGAKGGGNRQAVEQLSEDGSCLLKPGSTTGRQVAELGDALAAIFNHLGSPIEFDKLVGVLATLLPFRDQLMESTDQNGNAIGSPTAGAPDPAWQVEKRIFLERLWEEVRRLPLNQRAALLLNLREAEGGGCIALFPATGVATFRQLADTLEMSPEKFAELWNELPLEDARDCRPAATDAATGDQRTQISTCGTVDAAAERFI